jgi:hypothetical protein
MKPLTSFKTKPITNPPTPLPVRRNTRKVPSFLTVSKY